MILRALTLRCPTPLWLSNLCCPRLLKELRDCGAGMPLWRVALGFFPNLQKVTALRQTMSTFAYLWAMVCMFVAGVHIEMRRQPKLRIDGDPESENYNMLLDPGWSYPRSCHDLPHGFALDKDKGLVYLNGEATVMLFPLQFFFSLQFRFALQASPCVFTVFSVAYK